MCCVTNFKFVGKKKLKTHPFFKTSHVDCPYLFIDGLGFVVFIGLLP